MNNQMKSSQPKKLTVTDANLSDEKIPRNLILMYGDTPYIQKAGLEWKANQLFGAGAYSIKTEIVENNRKERYCLIKATLTILMNGSTFENYGEASLENTNQGMQKNMLHLAVTRAECRVLRMATACGYASYDEVLTLPKVVSTPKEFAEAKETAKILTHIDNAKTIEELEMCEDYLTDQTQEAYTAKIQYLHDKS